jgi:hypothetical protein
MLSVPPGPFFPIAATDQRARPASKAAPLKTEEAAYRGDGGKALGAPPPASSLLTVQLDAVQKAVSPRWLGCHLDVGYAQQPRKTSPWAVEPLRCRLV